MRGLAWVINGLVCEGSRDQFQGGTTTFDGVSFKWGRVEREDSEKVLGLTWLFLVLWLKCCGLYCLHCCCYIYIRTCLSIFVKLGEWSKAPVYDYMWNRKMWRLCHMCLFSSTTFTIACYLPFPHLSCIYVTDLPTEEEAKRQLKMWLNLIIRGLIQLVKSGVEFRNWKASKTKKVIKTEVEEELRIG